QSNREPPIFNPSIFNLQSSVCNGSARRAERVALARVAGVEAALEPGHALLGRAVRELLRHDAAVAELLQAIVADGGRRAQRFLEIARIQLHGAARRAAWLRGVVAPHAGIA